MIKINIEMDGFTFSGYARKNTFWADDLTETFNSLEDVYEKEGHIFAMFTTAGSPGLSEDGCRGLDCDKESCLHCQSAQREISEALVPFGIGVKHGDTIIKNEPDFNDIKDAYTQPVNKYRRSAPIKR